MWRLGLSGGGEAYPERSNEPDCIYYLRTGVCGYGSRCRFNHPRDRGAVIKVSQFRFVTFGFRSVRSWICCLGCWRCERRRRRRWSFAGEDGTTGLSGFVITQSLSLWWNNPNRTRSFLFFGLISILWEPERVSTVLLASIIILDKEVVPLRLSL